MLHKAILPLHLGFIVWIISPGMRSRCGGQPNSTLRSLDRIVDFDVRTGDRIQLNLSGSWSSIERPRGLFGVVSQRGGSLRNAIESAFQDKNQRQRGNQMLRANEAVLLTWRDRTFLAVNDSQSRVRSGRNFSPRHDSVIEMMRMEPIAAGVLKVEAYFA